MYCIIEADPGHWTKLRASDIEGAVAAFSTSDSTTTIDDIELMITVHRDQPEPDEIGFGRRREGPIVPVTEQFCGAATAVIGLKYLENKKTKYIRDIKDDLVTRRARELHQELGYSLDEPGWTIDHWETLTLAYPRLRVVHVIMRHGVVVERDVMQIRGAEFRMPGSGREGDDYGQTIIAMLTMPDQHYTLVLHHEFQWFQTEPWEAVKRCRACLEFFKVNVNTSKKRRFAAHSCREARPCKTCGTIFATLAELGKHQRHKGDKCMNGCEMHYYGDECMETHHKEICHYRYEESASIKQCYKCGAVHSRYDPCRPYKCPACKIGMSESEILTHRCYITRKLGEQWHKFAVKKGWKTRRERQRQTLNEIMPEEYCSPVIDDADQPDEEESEDLADLNTMWAADIESALDIVQGDSPVLEGRYRSYHGAEIRQHKPVLIQARNLGDKSRVVTFDGYDGTEAIDKFMRYFMKPWKKGQPKLRIWFHNGAKYDIRMILYWMELNMPRSINYKKSIIEGTRPKQLVCGSVVFMDSMLHLTGPLDGLVKTVGLNDEQLAEIGEQYGVSMRKGIWPYKFTTTETLITNPYVGPVPAIEWYEIERKSNAKDFEARYNKEIELAHGVWDQRAKLLEYIGSDVLILAVILERYRDLMLGAGMCDPLVCVTLPACCLKTYRRKFMPTECLPVIKCFPKSDNSMLDEEAFIRRGLKGGKTDTRCPYVGLTPAELEAGWSLRMYDFVSLYPTVMYNHPYPAGDLQWHEWTDTEQPTEHWIMTHEGMIELLIEFPIERHDPPYHPVLWNMYKGKFAYSLNSCEGQLPQVYTLVEVQHAIRRGYTVRKVFRTLTGEYIKYDLFNEYVTNAIGGKIRASKPPKLNWDDPAVCAAYRKEMHDSAGVIIPYDLNPRDWHQYNEGLRSIFKLCANSFFGKLCQNPFKDITETAETSEQEDRIWTSGKKIKAWIMRNDMAVYTLESGDPSDTLVGSCVILGAYVTAHARMRLWQLMEQYGDKVLYHDTDSVILKLGPSDTVPRTGGNLGELTDELDGKRGVEFAGLAPKTYCLKLETGEVAKIKAKGIPLDKDARNKAILSYDWMIKAGKDMLKGRVSEAVTYNPVWIGDRQLGMQLTIDKPFGQKEGGPMKKTSTPINPPDTHSGKA